MSGKQRVLCDTLFHTREMSDNNFLASVRRTIQYKTLVKSRREILTQPDSINIEIVYKNEERDKLVSCHL